MLDKSFKKLEKSFLDHRIETSSDPEYWKKKKEEGMTDEEAKMEWARLAWKRKYGTSEDFQKSWIEDRDSVIKKLKINLD
jgi:hypothetical protein